MKYLVPALATIAAAIIAAYATIHAASSQISESQKKASSAQRDAEAAEKSVQVLASVSGVPIGTVITSILPPKEFAVVVGDNGDFDASKSNWVPADGRSVAGSHYAKLVGRSSVADLRGVFLRGLNNFDTSMPLRKAEELDPQPNRVAGDFEADEFKEHNHGGGAHTHSVSTDREWSVRDGVGCVTSVGEATLTKGANVSGSTVDIIKPNGGAETRPKNAAVYYFIKIN